MVEIPDHYLVVICSLILIFEVLITAFTAETASRNAVVICSLILIFEVLITASEYFMPAANLL